MIRLLKSLEKGIVAFLRGCTYVSGGLITLLMVTTTVHVIARYAFKQPITGMLELSQFFMIVLLSLLFGYVTVEKMHAATDVIVNRLPARVQAVIDVVIYTAFLAFIALMSYQTFLYAIDIQSTGLTGSVIRIPYFPFYIVVGLGFALVSIAVVICLVHSVNAAVKKK